MICGWKSISEYTGRSRGTLLKMVKEQGFPIQKLFGKPTTTRQAVEKWFEDRLKVTESAYEGLSPKQINDRMLVL